MTKYDIIYSVFSAPSYFTEHLFRHRGSAELHVFLSRRLLDHFFFQLRSSLSFVVETEPVQEYDMERFHRRPASPTSGFLRRATVLVGVRDGGRWMAASGHRRCPLGGVVVTAAMALDAARNLGGFEAFGDETIRPPAEIAETQFRH